VAVGSALNDPAQIELLAARVRAVEGRPGR
jgi:hypothetical protein